MRVLSCCKEFSDIILYYYIFELSPSILISIYFYISEGITSFVNSIYISGLNVIIFLFTEIFISKKLYYQILTHYPVKFMISSELLQTH